ncbi:hypothetical protein [Vitiosangium sp. GDMCC 1.1324]|uniref:hypothetical protein n=1 Tax=Vitiosangium sp. (strain GDMCC 1.1324) TaxID=2138576 RepID=UPI000D39FED9|nr:hypothetical protein [Vitiosangium sp. GDMCC 1.1324]PTL84459.1 hypothetical protein DAT35_05050 [Vitiosangium sp. GDMCC 1.1324]
MARKHEHGAGRISAAVSAAPGAAVLADLALATVLPLPGDIRLLVALLAAAPAIVLAVCLALLARSGPRAWLGSVVVGAASAAVLVLS